MQTCPKPFKTMALMADATNNEKGEIKQEKEISDDHHSEHRDGVFELPAMGNLHMTKGFAHYRRKTAHG
jgi:hypothetical protein